MSTALWPAGAPLDGEGGFVGGPGPEGHLVACVGETMAAFVPDDLAPLDSARTLRIDVAGAESNVAMYLADHGVRVRWVSRLGDDAFGRRVARTVGAAGVDVSGVVFDPHRPTGLLFKDPAPAEAAEFRIGGGGGGGGGGGSASASGSGSGSGGGTSGGRGGSGTRVTYYRRGSAASAMTAELLDEPALREANLWHLSGITPALSPGCLALVRAAVSRTRTSARNRPAVSFDVNYRPALWDEAPGALLRELADAADVVFVGLDEAAALWGAAIREPSDVRTLLPSPQIVVVKDGAVGAVAFHRDGMAFAPSPRVEVVEPVGAGDAFAAGFLAELLMGGDAKRCLRSGHLAAACALTVTGDHGPLLDPVARETLLAADELGWAAAGPFRAVGG